MKSIKINQTNKLKMSKLKRTVKVLYLRLLRNFDVRENKWSYFTNYQYNYSYVRKIQSDNFL